jgi:hypothetical protein
MATPKFDRCCIELVKRIPDQFKVPFVAGTGVMPDCYMIKAVNIIDYINRGMQELFNTYWKLVAGDVQRFIGIFPELNKLSAAVPLVNGNYVFSTPYMDFYKIVGAVTATGNKFIKVKDEYLYTVYLSEEYNALKPDENNPAIIQVNKMLAVFPQSFTGQIKFHYIAVPLDPSTGGFIEQNGGTDSPFFDHWNKEIVDNAYLKYLEETNQTS